MISAEKKVSKNILIVGGSGFVGKLLTEKLKNEGYEVSWLTRKKNTSINIKQYEWNFKKNQVDINAFRDNDTMINLMGKSLFSKRWDDALKQEIYDSRVKATHFLFEILSKNKHRIHTVIASSAVGYYGNSTSEKIYSENDFPGNDFLAKLCYDWEMASFQFTQIGIRKVCIRMGIILDKKNGALFQIQKPYKAGISFPLGNGKFYFPWIHYSDLLNTFLFALKNQKLSGVFNAVAPEYLTNTEANEIMIKAYKTKINLPFIPKFFMRLKFGEFADYLINGSRISSEKLMNAGFHFQFTKFHDAVSDLM